MAILGALLAFVGRQAGRVVNVIFGWTTTMLFGKVRSDKQVWLSVFALASVAWLASLLSTIWPAFGAFMLAFAPTPGWVNPTWIRLAMLGAIVVLPLVVGAISSLFLAEWKSRCWRFSPGWPSLRVSVRSSLSRNQDEQHNPLTYSDVGRVIRNSFGTLPADG